MLRWTFLLVILLFLFTGCGDLEPEMQDTRTVILNMDFHGKSSLRSSSSVSASELSQYNTHLILALPSGEVLTSNYNNFSSSLAQGLMNTADKKVSLEIPLNTQMKIFAFLFQENYSMSELILGTRTVGYYGKSQTFSISTNTNSLSLGITLKAASGNEDDSTGGGGGGDQGGTDTTAPVIAEVYPVTTQTSNSTPNYTFSSTKDGTISYGGSCSSNTTYAISGNNTITFNTLSDDTYYNCTITVKDSAGNVSNTLSVTTFTVDTTGTGTETGTGTGTGAGTETGTGDTAAPTITSFTSTTNNGSYNSADTVNITATASEAVVAGNTITATLDTGDTVLLTAAANGTTLVGTYTVGAGDNSNDLTVSSFSIGTMTDIAGNAMASTTVPGTNIASGSAIVIDTTAPTVSLVTTTADNQSSVSITDNITVTFSEAMEPSYIDTNTSDTYCSGSIQVSSTNFSSGSGSCVR